MNFSRWDWHGPDGKNFVEGRKDMPLLDQAISALVTDLHERGLDKDVSVVVWGEFGRTPRVNKSAGRDHWPQVSCALLAGGGMRTGQVIGETNRLAEFAVKRPVTFQEVFATLYTNIGINLSEARVLDTTGRPQYLVESGNEPIKELIYLAVEGKAVSLACWSISRQAETLAAMGDPQASETLAATSGRFAKTT